MRYLLTVVLAVGVAASLPLTPEAKPLSEMLAKSGLSPADFEQMAAAEQALLNRADPHAGQEITWSNPDSGSHGTAQIVAVQDGCVQLLHKVHPKGQADPVDLPVKMCKSTDGRWLLTL